MGRRCRAAAAHRVWRRQATGCRRARSAAPRSARRVLHRELGEERDPHRAAHVKTDFAFAWRDALAHLPTADGKRFTVVFEHGTLALELYAPRGDDPQKPHTRDELYVVVAGRG